MTEIEKTDGDRISSPTFRLIVVKPLITSDPENETTSGMSPFFEYDQNSNYPFTLLIAILALSREFERYDALHVQVRNNYDCSRA